MTQTKSLEILIKKIGGVLKTGRVLSEARGVHYHISTIYKWRERGYIPPAWWNTVHELSGYEITLSQLLQEYEEVHPL